MHVRAPFCHVPPPLAADFSHDAWGAASPLAIDRLWSGDPAPAALVSTARVFWTPADLWIGFECGYSELDIDSEVDTTVERVALWDRDVCEAFIWNPREPRPDSYKEFEVAPTAQWCDLVIHRPRLDVDWRWNSGMATAAAIDAEARVWRVVMRLPFTAFDGAPSPGDEWRVNLYRISRVDGARHYLSYAPTGTSTPDFHVPACFVPLSFEPLMSPGR